MKEDGNQALFFSIRSCKWHVSNPVREEDRFLKHIFCNSLRIQSKLKLSRHYRIESVLHMNNKLVGRPMFEKQRLSVSI